MLSRIPPRMVIYICLVIAISTIFLRNIVYTDARLYTGNPPAEWQERVISPEHDDVTHNRMDTLAVSGNEK